MCNKCNHFAEGRAQDTELRQRCKELLVSTGERREVLRQVAHRPAAIPGRSAEQLSLVDARLDPVRAGCPVQIAANR